MRVKSAMGEVDIHYGRISAVSKLKILLIILIVIVLAVVVAALVVDSKYAVLKASPRIALDTLVAPQTRALVSIDVPKAKGIIEERFLKGTKIPAWVLPPVLPYEAGLVANIDYSSAQMQMKLFVNDQRLHPIILDQANAVQFPPPWGQWFPEKMKREKPGLLSRDGVGPMDRKALGKIREIWKSTKVPDVVKLKGGHFFEAAIDNRDGAALAITAAIAAAVAPGLDVISGVLDNYQAVVLDVVAVRLWGDLVDPSALNVKLVLDCSAEMDPEMLKVFAFGLDYGYAAYVAPELKRRGVDVQAKSELKDGSVEATYTVKDINALLAML